MRFAIARPSATLTVAAGLLSAAACAPSGSPPGAAPAPAANMSTNAPSPDPRVGLKAGLWDAGQAAWNVRLVSTNRPTGKFLGETNSDMAFMGHYVIQGSYSGFQIWDDSDTNHVKLRTAYYCPDAQSDVSVYKNLLFVSGEKNEGRLDCGAEGPKYPASPQ